MGLTKPPRSTQITFTVQSDVGVARSNISLTLGGTSKTTDINGQAVFTVNGKTGAVS